MDQPASAPHPIIDHQGLEVLSNDECWRLLRDSPVGRVAFVYEGEPSVLPVNHAVVAHHIVFRTARGSKFAAAVMNQAVAIEVDGWDGDAQTGWSVLARGTAEVVLDPDQLRELAEVDVHPWAHEVERTEWVRVLPSEISGRRLRVAP